VRAFYERVQAQINERGLRDNFIFHEWIPEDLMPEYYNLGSLTLCLGSFVETFGNVPYESLGCGTPAIVARVGPHRDNLPDSLVDKVDFDDPQTAAEKAARILREQRRTPPETISYLHKHFSIEGMMQTYAETITSAKKRGGLNYRLKPLDDTTIFRLARWCYLSPRGFYHDFRADYAQLPELEALLRAFPDGFTFAQAEQLGTAREMVMGWYREGYVVVGS
jgi:hypothetical protein